MQNQGMLGHGHVAHFTGFAQFNGWYIGVQIMVTEIKLVVCRNCMYDVCRKVSFYGTRENNWKRHHKALLLSHLKESILWWLYSCISRYDISFGEVLTVAIARIEN